MMAALPMPSWEMTMATVLSPEDAAQTLWALLSVPLWIQLREDADWSAEQYRRRLSAVAVAALCGTDRPDVG